MATYSRDLKKQMQQYIDVEETASLEFRNLLQSTTAEIRYKLLMEVRGVKYTETTGVFNAAHIRDLSGAKCMLDGMSEEQKFNTLKIAYGNGFTPLHVAVCEKRDHPYSSEVAKELTNNLSTKQLYQLLQMKSKSSEHTVLHYAAYYNRVDFVTRILAQLTWDQNHKLLSIRNAAGATPADLSVTTIFSTVQGLREAQQKIERVNGELVKQGTAQSQLSDRCKELEAERAQQLKETKNALVDLQTTSDEEKEKLQKKILQMEQNMLKQTEDLQKTKKELADIKKTTDAQVETNLQLTKTKEEQTQVLQKTDKAVAVIQERIYKQIQELDNKNIQLEKQQTQELKQAHENVKTLQEELTEQKEMQIQVVARCTELERQKVQQEEVMAEQRRELEEQRAELKQAHENVKTLQEEFTEQKEMQIQVVARCTELEIQKVQQDEVIAEQRGELLEQRAVIQVMSARQAAMEQILERLELEFRRPIVTDETGDHENEDY